MAGYRAEILQLTTPVADAQGRGGITGDVDNRFWERYGTAFVLAGISAAVRLGRSEEHTSELQSLMRISSAVFCLTRTHDTATLTQTQPLCDSTITLNTRT